MSGLTNTLLPAFLIFLTGTALAKYPDPCDESCAVALEAVISSGAISIVSGSSCDGDYGQKGVPTIANLLTRELSGFGRGANSIKGECDKRKPMHCVLGFYHSNGDDVSSLDVRFALVSGKVVPTSLDCIMTP